jgi:AraC-like DNA-binding protein
MAKQISGQYSERPEMMEPGVHILQSRRACFHNIISPVPAIIWVLSGTKRVSTDRETREVSRDYFVLLPENRPITVENIPENCQPYEARVLAFDREYFETAYRRLTITEDERRRSFQTAVVTQQISEAFVRARSALSDRDYLPKSVLQNRCEEVILWLAEVGACLPWAKPTSFADRVRAVVATNPSHGWTSIEVGRELAASEATLRRKLQAEGTSFKVILLDIRMVVGLTYLQTTNWLISRVAAEVGYMSQSRFSARFKERFGLHPADIRKPQRE